ncbi:pentatricopeptide repeat-containing protein At2g30780-like [Curcuma longa]|uniref:pentatricopeptide repeat-containing protein At2g30780-like n=1 Tax=Curcuma longa TaxID=136217 RepID=UPI003D9F6216
MARLKQLVSLLPPRRRFSSLRSTIPRFRSSTLARRPHAAPAGPRWFCSEDISDLRERILLLSESPSEVSKEDKESLRSSVHTLAEELLALPDGQGLEASLGSGCFPDLLRRPPAGFASLELLSALKWHPLLALQVFDWRKKLACEIPVLAEEYSKAISLAGRAHNVTLATKLFCDAIAAGINETCIYNGLLSSCMYNGQTIRAMFVFEDMKKDTKCKPTIVTYNILLSLFSRSMLMDHLEKVLKAIEDSELPYTINTYNTVIAAYVTAWRWDKMEKIYQSMLEGPIKPDVTTLFLMLRGYAHSRNFEKMEQIYDQVKEIANSQHVSVLRTMICAYAKSSQPNRIKKVEALMKLIPEDGYRAWLNVLLIRMYAQEGLIEVMERFISEAFQQQTIVSTRGVMRSILTGYFKNNAVDRLAEFLKKAESAGWRLCRSLYHCKMVMYGQQNRLGEMHGVLDEMENFRFNRTRKTFLILYKAYANTGRRSEAESIFGMMWKHGLGNSNDSLVT